MGLQEGRRATKIRLIFIKLAAQSGFIGLGVVAGQQRAEFQLISRSARWIQ